jgi:hypothetical protein
MAGLGTALVPELPKPAAKIEWTRSTAPKAILSSNAVVPRPSPHPIPNYAKPPPSVLAAPRIPREARALPVIPREDPEEDDDADDAYTRKRVVPEKRRSPSQRPTLPATEEIVLLRESEEPLAPRAAGQPPTSDGTTAKVSPVATLRADSAAEPFLSASSPDELEPVDTFGSSGTMVVSSDRPSGVSPQKDHRDSTPAPLPLVRARHVPVARRPTRPPILTMATGAIAALVIGWWRYDPVSFRAVRQGAVHKFVAIAASMHGGRSSPPERRAASPPPSLATLASVPPPQAAPVAASPNETAVAAATAPSASAVAPSGTPSDAGADATPRKRRPVKSGDNPY